VNAQRLKLTLTVVGAEGRLERCGTFMLEVQTIPMPRQCGVQSSSCEVGEVVYRQRFNALRVERPMMGGARFLRCIRSKCVDLKPDLLDMARNPARALAPEDRGPQDRDGKANLQMIPAPTLRRHQEMQRRTLMVGHRRPLHSVSHRCRSNLPDIRASDDHRWHALGPEAL
jgi:hypothetical protein